MEAWGEGKTGGMEEKRKKGLAIISFDLTGLALTESVLRLVGKKISCLPVACFDIIAQSMKICVKEITYRSFETCSF